jgi:hypothetical protein
MLVKLTHLLIALLALFPLFGRAQLPVLDLCPTWWYSAPAPWYWGTGSYPEPPWDYETGLYNTYHISLCVDFYSHFICSLFAASLYHMEQYSER